MAETPQAVDHALRALARQIETGSPSTQLTTAILDRIATEPVPGRSSTRILAGRMGDWILARLRWTVGLLVALLLSGLVVSPVGAQIADWFGFHGVIISTDAPAPTGSPDVPGAGESLAPDEAAALVDFGPYLPDLLGAPDEVGVSEDGRLLSMSWTTPASGTIRLDQFDGTISPQFWKLARAPVLVSVGSNDGLWIPGPHEVVVLDESGAEETLPPRLAAQTLIWARGDRTLRLEGDLTRERAVEIAESVH